MSVVWSVLLVILKIIGFTLLGLIGLALLLLLVVLFVPVRYRASVSYHDKPKIDARVTWLLHLLRIRFRLDGKENELTAKILFFKLLDGNKDTDKSGGAEETEEETAEETGGSEGKPGAAAEKAGGTAEKSSDDSETKPIEINTDESTKKELSVTEDGKKEQSERPGTRKEGSGKESPRKEAAGEKKKQTADRKLTKAEKDKIKAEKARLKAEKKREKAEKKRLKAEEKERKKREKEEKKAAGTLESRLDSLKKKLEDLRDKKDTIMGYVNDPANRRALSTAWNGVKKFFAHILPTKAKGSVYFGLDDPATTGKILAGAGIFYAKYGKWLAITPDFENKVIEADLFIKGRIRFFTIAVIALKVYFNKDVKYVIKEYKDIKENGLFRDKEEDKEKNNG